MPTLRITTSRPELLHTRDGGGSAGGKSKKRKGSAGSRYNKLKLKRKPTGGKYSYNNSVEQNQSLFTNEAKTAQIDNKSYLIVPGVPVREQVMNTYLLPASEIHPEEWDGTPISIKHAQQNGGSVQVENPDVPIIGYITNTSWDSHNKRMLADYYFDEIEAMRYPDGQMIIAAIKNGQMVETSTAYWADEQYTSGNFNGRDYKTIHRNPKRDHVAVFPPEGQIGACSIQDGCGVNRNMQHNCEQCTHQQGAAHPWHKGRPGQKGGSTSTSASAAQTATKSADRVTKLAMEKQTPEAYKVAMEYHMRAAKKNFEAYQDTKETDPESASSFKRMVMEHEGTAQILERRMKSNALAYHGIFANVTGSLSGEGKALWEKIYNANKDKSEESAAKIAWAAVKKAGWHKKDGKWVKQNNSSDGYPEYKQGHLPTVMLIGYALNKGSRTQEQLESSRKFAEKNGITKPVWVQCNHDKYRIFDGNHRVYLAEELGIEQIPVRVVNEHLMELDPEVIYYKWLHEKDQGYLS